MPRKKKTENEAEVLEMKNPEELTEKEVAKLAEAESTTLEKDVEEKRKNFLKKLRNLKVKSTLQIQKI